MLALVSRDLGDVFFFSFLMCMRWISFVEPLRTESMGWNGAIMERLTINPLGISILHPSSLCYARDIGPVILGRNVFTGCTLLLLGYAAIPRYGRHEQKPVCRTDSLT
jgi:hypothetical protein